MRHPLQKPLMFSGILFILSGLVVRTLLILWTEVNVWIPNCLTFIICRDPNELKRTATHISWFPDGPKKLAIAYCNLDFQGSSADTSMDSYIWDVGMYSLSAQSIELHGTVLHIADFNIQRDDPFSHRESQQAWDDLEACFTSRLLRVQSQRLTYFGSWTIQWADW